MLPSVVAKCLYRKLNRCSSDYKFFHSVCYGSTRVQRSQIFAGDTTSPWRFISGSAYYYENSKPKDAASHQSDKSHQKVISQSATGDIIVKTETDANKMVTKLTIEKNLSQDEENKHAVTAPPGKNKHKF